MVEGVQEVAEDALHDSEMELMGVMHVGAQMLDRVGDVRPSEGEVLESPDQAEVGSWVTDEGLMSEETLAWVSTNVVRFEVTHASALKNVPSILVPVKEDVIKSLLQWDTEEMEMARVLLLGTELSLSSRGRMTLGVGAIFWFISHTLPQCHALQGVGDTYL
jgi:hypothetical protein